MKNSTVLIALVLLMSSSLLHAAGGSGGRPGRINSPFNMYVTAFCVKKKDYRKFGRKNNRPFATYAYNLRFAYGKYKRQVLSFNPITRRRGYFSRIYLDSGIERTIRTSTQKLSDLDQATFQSESEEKRRALLHSKGTYSPFKNIPGLTCLVLTPGECIKELAVSWIKTEHFATPVITAIWVKTNWGFSKRLLNSSYRVPRDSHKTYRARRGYEIAGVNVRYGDVLDAVRPRYRSANASGRTSCMSKRHARAADLRVNPRRARTRSRNRPIKRKKRVRRMRKYTPKVDYRKYIRVK